MKKTKTIFKLKIWLSKNDQHPNPIIGWYPQVFNFPSDISSKEKLYCLKENILTQIKIEQLFTLAYFDDRSDPYEMTNIAFICRELIDSIELLEIVSDIKMKM